MGDQVFNSLRRFPDGMPGGGGMPGMLGAMGSVNGVRDILGLPSMGGIPSSQQFWNNGFDNINSGHTNQVNPITYQTGIDYRDEAGSFMGKHELMCLKREPSSENGTGHIAKTWTAMNQYFVETEAQRKYNSLRHHAEEVLSNRESRSNIVTRGISVDWKLLQDVQVNQLEKYEQVGFFNENIVNFHVARRVEVFNYWAVENQAIREGLWLFALLIKCSFDSDLADLCAVVPTSRKRKLYDTNFQILTKESEKNVLKSSSSRHQIAWQLTPYADVSPAGAPRNLYSTDAFCGQQIPIGYVAETYYKQGVSQPDEAHHAKVALFPTYRGKSAINWETVAKNALNSTSKLRIDLRL